MKKEYGYTLVQHSAYGYKQDRTFARGVESRALSTKEALQRVQKAGGLVLTSYTEAEDRAFAEMYPPEAHTFLTPVARGTFSNSVIDGLAIYVPAKA